MVRLGPPAVPSAGLEVLEVEKSVRMHFGWHKALKESIGLMGNTSDLSLLPVLVTKAAREATGK